MSLRPLNEELLGVVGENGTNLAVELQEFGQLLFLVLHVGYSHIRLAKHIVRFLRRAVGPHETESLDQTRVCAQDRLDGATGRTRRWHQPVGGGLLHAAPRLELSLPGVGG